MPRSIFVLVEELQSTLTELSQAVSLLKTAGTKATGGPTRRRTPLSPALATAVALTETTKDQLAVRPKKRSKAATAKLVLQGQYMAAVRSLSKRAKAEVKTVRAAKGVEAAIALAQSKRK